MKLAPSFHTRIHETVRKWSGALLLSTNELEVNLIEVKELRYNEKYHLN